MSLKGFSAVCLKGALVALAVMMCAWSVPTARAGAIRSAGRMVARGTAVAAAATVAGSHAAVNRVESDAVPVTSNAGNSVKRAFVNAGHATTNGAKDGGAAVYYAAKRAPHTAAHGAQSVWRAMW